MRRFPFEGVVLIADVFRDGTHAGDYAARRDLEQTEEPTLTEISVAIRALGLIVHHYETPAQLAANARKHLKDVVLSIYGGAGSRSRMALAPAVCEAFGLRYIGPDAYGRIVAQDKEVSKRLASEYGLKTPPWRVIRTPGEVSTVETLPPPLVIKPLLEGSSIGISGESLQVTCEGACTVAADLLEAFGQPVIAERFVPGREVSYNKIEGAGAGAWSFSEVVIDGNPSYFHDRLFDAQEKMVRQPGRCVVNIDRELDPEDKERLDRFLSAFGRYGYCRVDGRLDEGRFAFIELTPDAWLGRLGQFAVGFIEQGWCYEDVIAAILGSAN
jgi:D-alanine-D-alanine ligase